MFCGKCGKEIDENSDFCKYCGNKIKADQTANENPNDTEISSQETRDSGKAVKLSKKSKKFIGLIGKIAASFGTIGFILIAAIGFILYKSVYFYDGYSFTKVLSTICLVSMIIGVVFIVTDLLIQRNWASLKKKNLIFLVCITTLAIAFSVILIVNAVKSSPKSSSSGSSSNYSYTMDHDLYCRVYMKISNVSVTHSGNYAYVSGTITNNGTYQVKFVKVKAVCKDSYGSIVDTDWTYAVDSSWFDPGESKSFEMMIKDPNRKISRADVSVLTD